MIVSVFYWLTEKAGDPEIIPFIRAAVFKRDDMLYNPSAFVAGAELVAALPAASAALKKQLGRLLS